MKFLINFFSCLLCLIVKSQSTNNLSTIEIKYNFTYLLDTLDSKNSISEPMILLANGKESVYYSENHKKFINGFQSKIENAIKTGNVVDPSNLPKARVKHSVYKDNEGIFITNTLGSHKYTYNPEQKIKWTINNSESKNIIGYKCFKATAKIEGRDYIAWFTKDIPLSDGPYKFKGLPGLILKLNEVHNYFTFEPISISKIKLPIEYKKEIIITEKQYINKRNEYLNDPSQGKINTPEYRKRIEENKKKYNNFLEN